MKKKLSFAVVIFLVLFITGNSFVLGQNTDQSSQQSQNAQQGNDDSADDNSQPANDTGNQVQNQNQITNQGEDSQIQNQETEQTEEQGQTEEEKEQASQAAQRKKQVENAVQKMLQITEQNSGVNQQIRNLTQTQTQVQEQLETSLKKVQDRNKVLKFFIGPDYKELKNMQETLAQNRERISQLIQIKNQLTNAGDAQILNEQIQLLEQTNLEIENKMQNSQKGFSLLGWLIKLFY